MGAACCKASGTDQLSNAESQKGTLHIMFDRIDKEKKGYISMKNLEDLMHDDAGFFQGKDTTHIMQKYGSDDKMTFEQFKGWWGSTYTTYGVAEEVNLSKLVDEVNDEKNNKEQQQLDPISEISDSIPELKGRPLSLSYNKGSKKGTNHALDTLAVSRS